MMYAVIALQTVALLALVVYVWRLGLLVNEMDTFCLPHIAKRLNRIESVLIPNASNRSR